MMFMGHIGWSALSMSFVIGDGLGGDRVLCIVVGCSWLFPSMWDECNGTFVENSDGSVVVDYVLC